MVEISSRDKVMFPEAGITKGDLIDYYDAVAPVMLPHLVGRPLTLERFPSGIHHKGFMQKNAPDYFPDYIDRFAMTRNDGETVFPVVHDRDGLIYLANQNTVTFHAPTFEVSSPGTPDRMIFDLDPAPGRTDDARQAALVIRNFLDQLELPCLVTTTGSKGFHVVVPLDRTTEGVPVAEVAQGIAALAAAHEPSLLTLEFQKKNRKERVFVDWLRNGFGATAVVPWSVRPRPGAPVAMPISWDEIADTEPDRWNVTNAVERIKAGAWERFEASRSGLDIAASAVQTLLDTRGIELQKFDRFRS